MTDTRGLRTLDTEAVAGLTYTEQANTPPLVPVIAQDAATGAVLMLAWADRPALEESLRSGRMHYYSRSRGARWMKGETSGHIQTVRALLADCDGDAVLALVEQEGPACHTEATTCWHQGGDDAPDAGGILGTLMRVIADRQAHPQAGSHTNRLLDDANLRRKKVGEEAGEFLLAAGGGDRAGMVSEAADLLYHLVVALQAEDLPFEAVLRELDRRHAKA